MSEKPSKFEKCHETRKLIDAKILAIITILTKMNDYNTNDTRYYDYDKLKSNLEKLNAVMKILRGVDK